jgi:hypothetical protein
MRVPAATAVGGAALLDRFTQLKGSGMQHINPLMPLLPQGGQARDHSATWIRTSVRSFGRQP